MSRILLYDIPCPGRSACWSFNVWKVRLVMNYKKIPYHTEWIEHPDIEPLFKSLGIPPAPSGPGAAYTVPTIRLPDGRYISDSLAITNYLEEEYPSPSLRLESGLHLTAIQTVGKASFPLIPVFMPLVGRNKLCPKSVPWFHKSRSEKFGMRLDELEKQRGGEKAWEAARPGIRDLAKVLRENKKDEGPFVLGKEVSYADFVIVALIEALNRIGGGMKDEFVKIDERFEEVHEACKQWLEKDD